jgi:hypothetical protein
MLSYDSGSELRCEVWVAAQLFSVFVDSYMLLNLILNLLLATRVVKPSQSP